MNSASVNNWTCVSEVFCVRGYEREFVCVTEQSETLCSEILRVESLLLGSLSLLQVIFPTQESNWGLLHCRRILYQLSYEGTPFTMLIYVNIECVNILHTLSICKVYICLYICNN